MSLQYHFGGLQFLQNMARVFASIVSLCLGILDRLLQQFDLQRRRSLLKCKLVYCFFAVLQQSCFSGLQPAEMHH